ncbi:MAG: hypothetical protein IPI34_13740 [bacterium]|nr:hypothetical protein [bacterium]
MQIEPVVLRHDLRRGQAMVRLRMPLEWEGLYCDLRLDNVTNNYYGRDGDGIEDGWAEFVMPALEPGAYVMEFTPPNSYDSIYLPGTLDAAEADTLVVGLDAVAGYERTSRGPTSPFPVG